MELNLSQFKEFPVSIFGELEKFSETISKARVRIFYKGINRNGSLITEEFAEKLIKTLPYSPVKGIYDEIDEDYTDHGEERTQGRAYGVVMGPDDMDFKWEKHMDEDGVEREYACANVILWTALYKEAKDIVGKSQSMELYEKSIEGTVKVVEGRRVFEFSEGAFLGLQALGDEVEPCFEGSAFFSLYTSLKDLVNEFSKIEKSPKELEEGGQPKMDMPKVFKLSDDQKADAIYSILNAEEFKYAVLDVYENYAVAYNFADAQYEQIYYTKSDANDSVELGERKKCYIMDLTEEEKAAVDALHAANGNSFEKLEENFVSAEKVAEKESKIVELEASISTLNQEKENFDAQMNEINEKVSALENENKELNDFKLNVQNAEKQAVIDRYTEMIDDTVLASYTEKISDYSLENLEKDLAFELVKSNPTVFTKKAPVLIPNDEVGSGLADVLSKYNK